MRLRRQLRLRRQRDLWPSRIVRHRKRLYKRLRSSRDQVQMHICPVGPGRVVDHRPTLQRGIRICPRRRRREEYPVRRLPHRHLGDIGHSQLPRSCCASLRCTIEQRQVPQALVAGTRQQLQVARDVCMQRRIEQRHGDRRGQLHRSHLPRLRDDRDKPACRRWLRSRWTAIFCRRCAQVDRKQPARNAGSRSSHGYSRAAYRIVEIDIARVAVQRQRHRP